MTKKYAKKINCPLCFSKSFKIMCKSSLKKEDYDLSVLKKHFKNSLDDYTKHAQLVRCNSCSLVYTNPMEDSKWILQIYKNIVDTEYLDTEVFRKKLSQKHLNLLKTFKKTGNILDIGCFAGFFLELAKKNGWHVYGIEPSVWAAKIAKKKGVKIIGADFQRISKKTLKFDIITLWDVIEHLPNPHSFMNFIRKFLKEDGIIALGTPNIESFAAKILKEKYPHLIRMHVCLYSPKTIEILLKQYGFSIIHYSTYGRIYPVSYFFERIKTGFPVLNILRRLVYLHKSIAEFSLHLNFHDEFVVIAKKTSSN